MALVTVATVKQYLPEITGSGADSDLTALITRAESEIARYLGFPLYDSGSSASLDDLTYTIYLDGPSYLDRSVLQLPIKPIVSITSVHSDPNREYGSQHAISGTEYDLDKQNARLILKPKEATQGFDSGARAIKVVCVAGYATAPADLEHAICVFVAHLHRAKSAQGKESNAQRGATVNYSPRTMPPEVKEILYSYRGSGIVA